MEKRADWIKEIYVDQADNSNKLKAQTDVTGSKVLTGISQIQYEIPGFVDFHLHAGWTDFDHDDQEKRSSLDVEGRIKRCLNELAAMGFRIVRDAGGLECIKADAWKQSTKENALSVVECSGMVNGENAKDSAFQNCIKKTKQFVGKDFCNRRCRCTTRESTDSNNEKRNIFQAGTRLSCGWKTCHGSYMGRRQPRLVH